MNRVPLGEYAARIHTHKPRDNGSAEFTYIDLSSVDNRAKRIVAPSVVAAAEAPSRARQIVATGDVLVSTVRPNLNAVATVPKELDGATASTGFTVIRPNYQCLDGRYVFHWVRSSQFVGDMVRKATGASYPAVSDKIVKESLIPFPQLSEQRRIADILDKADDLRAKRRKTIAHLDGLGQSIYVAMFGDPLVSPNLWHHKSVGDVCSDVVDCVNRTAPLADAPTPYKMIRTSNVRNRSIDLTSVNYVEEQTFMIWNRRLTPRAGDVVLTREAPMGEAGIVPANEQVFLGQRTMLYRPDVSVLTPEYLLYTLTSRYMENEFRKYGAGTTVKHLSVPYCRSFSLPVPPLHLQQHFARRVAAVDSLKSKLRAQLSELDNLFLSLQDRAFKGEL
ncbi:restriction endonuclease subunit S [Glutamicibacter arilaitensis]|uniref:restriction endonuclease subunit S n=1 Tax=Glutamicibacter arilaitensis TaxID=256701 RepID=UPI003FD5E78E